MDSQENVDQTFDEYGQYHLIDDDANLREGMDEYIKNINILESKRDYNMISVIGSQSSGKSTLLNNLFGTHFKVMTVGKRSQTTKGIFMSKDKEKNLLILDVEGTDSKERWDDRLFYAKSTGIFALALSQVLVINIWTQNVGQYEGQQLGIIKTIFEMNLKLFSVDQVKNIVFVLRDFQDEEDLNYVRNSISKDLIKIWDEIQKPEQHKNTKPEDLFHIDYIPLTSFKFNKSGFESQVAELRNRFVDNQNSDYFFKQFDYSQNLPIDGLPDYIKNVWETIRENKDINLPNEKEIVAQIRCEAIKNEALDIARPFITDLEKQVEKGVSFNFNEIGQSAYKGAIEYYDQKADYMPKIVEQKKAELVQTVLSTLYTHFVTQMQQAKTMLAFQLDQQLSGSFHGGIKSNLQKMQNAWDQSKQEVQNILINSLVVNDVWDIQKYSDEFDILIESALENKYNQILNKEFTNSIDDTVIIRFNEFSLSFWDDIQKDYNECVRKLQDDYIPALKFSKHKQQSLTNQFQDFIYDTLEHKLKEKLVTINDNMIKKFHKIFAFTEKETPENWKSLEQEKIDEKFTTTKKDVLKILEIFKYNKIQKKQIPSLRQVQSSIYSGNQSKLNTDNINLDDSDYPRLLNEIELQKIKQEFDKQTNEEMESTIRAKNSTDYFGIPKAFWILIIFLGYDDVFRWLSNPFLTTPLFLLVGLVGLAYATGNQALLLTGFGLVQSVIGSQVKKYLK